MRTYRFPVLIATVALFLAANRVNGADSDLDQLKAELQKQIDAVKADYESRVQILEKRIGTLEADNARLKKQGAPAVTTGTTREIATLNRRITELEVSGGKPTPETKAQAARVTANAQAIEAIEAKLQASATETRDIYRDEGWGFD